MAVNILYATQLLIFWHKRLNAYRPEAKLAIGPAIDKGFYYDIDMEHTLTPEDLTKIEKEMSRIVKENLLSLNP